ncbi:MAG: TetR/AcrR family transcriptional regulator [Deltaproteobacteria bacterium]|nr:MAG: TetR/AcrR family transcriptional regulator [Deltaproteobacteria bacterium]
MNTHSKSEKAEAKPDKAVRIKDAATRVFANKGFYNSTIADVAKVAEVAEGTIYLYFKNKDDLLISIFEGSMDFFIQQVTQEIATVKNPEDKLKKFISLHLRLVQENPDLAQVLQIELRQSTKFMKEYEGGKFGDYLNVVRNILEEGREQGVFRKDIEPRILRRTIFGAVDEMALDWLLMPKKKYTLEACAEQLSALFLKGIIN